MKTSIFNKVTRKQRIEWEFSGSVQVSNGEVFKPYMSLVSTPDEAGYYVIFHKKNCLPNVSAIMNKGDKIEADNYTAINIGWYYHSILSSALLNWESQDNKEHLNPFTWIYAYCKFKFGTDLFVDGIFEL